LLIAKRRNYLAPSRKAPALALSGALVACLEIVSGCLFIAQKSAEDPVRQSASGLVVVILSPSSMRTVDTTQFLTLPPRDVYVNFELELSNTSGAKDDHHIV
jgi:hypothetical protein